MANTKHPAHADCGCSDGLIRWGNGGWVTCGDCLGSGKLCTWCGGAVDNEYGDGQCLRCCSLDAEREAAPSKAAYRAMEDAA